MNTALSIVVGVCTGLLSSFSVWWILFHRFRPVLRWCDRLVLFESPPSDLRCQPRLINVGKRSIIDVDIVGRVRAVGLIREGTPDWLTIYDHRIPVIPAGGSRRFSMSTDTYPDKGDLARMAPRYGGKLAEDFANGEKIGVERFMREAPEGATLEVTAIASDEYSGSRHAVVRTYTVDDIEEGRFVDEPSCRIKPASGAPSDPDVSGSPDG